MKFLNLFLFLFLIILPQGARADCTSPAAPAGRMDYFGAPDNTFKFCDGTNWVSMATGSGGGCHPADLQTFAANGTWTKPSCGSLALVKCWGGGGGGGRGLNSNNPATGGGGGGYFERLFQLSELAATEAVVIGAGGAGRTGSAGNGTAGGNTTFAGLTAYGGGGGRSSTTVGVGGNGGVNVVTAFSGGAGTASVIYGGGGGGSWDDVGDIHVPGGQSLFGGNGGTGGGSAAAIPGGGGAAGTGTGGLASGSPGARGECRVLVW